MKTKILIGINGYAHSGKDTIAQLMKTIFETKHLMSVKLYAFADPLKNCLKDIFKLTNDQLYDTKQKEVKDIFWNKSPRELLQSIGTDLFRNKFDKDIWIKSFQKSYFTMKEDVVIVTDVRFNNEAQSLINMGGIVINIQRNVEKICNSSHESEQGIDKQYIDFIIDNNYSLDIMELHLESTCLNIIKQFKC